MELCSHWEINKRLRECATSIFGECPIGITWLLRDRMEIMQVDHDISLRELAQIRIPEACRRVILAQLNEKIDHALQKRYGPELPGSGYEIGRELLERIRPGRCLTITLRACLVWPDGDRPVLQEKRDG